MRVPTRNPVRSIFVTVALLSLAACHVTLLADYDEVFDREATNAQKDVDALYLKIIDNTDSQHPDITGETFAADRDGYLKVRAELDGLLVRAQAHDHNENMVKSVKDIIHSFSVVEQEHKANPALHIAAARGELDLFNQQFTALIRQELLKKQGQDGVK